MQLKYTTYVKDNVFARVARVAELMLFKPRRLKSITDTETDTHHESNAQAAENCSRKNRTCLRMTGELSLDPEQQNNNNNNNNNNN